MPCHFANRRRHPPAISIWPAPLSGPRRSSHGRPPGSDCAPSVSSSVPAAPARGSPPPLLNEADRQPPGLTACHPFTLKPPVQRERVRCSLDLGLNCLNQADCWNCSRERNRLSHTVRAQRLLHLTGWPVDQMEEEDRGRYKWAWASSSFAFIVFHYSFASG